MGENKNEPLALIGMRKGNFTPLEILGLDFVRRICIKNFQTFLEVKIKINWANLIDSYKTCS